MRESKILVGGAVHLATAMAATTVAMAPAGQMVMDGQHRRFGWDLGPDPETPAEYGRRGRRNGHYGGRRYAAGAYKGSRFAKRATKRGGNPARQG